MLSITLEDYLMCRDKKYPCSDDIKNNAKETIYRANKLIELLAEKNIPLELNKQFGLVDSGWRPPEINAATPNAAKKSNHMIGKAVDINDPSGAIDEFLLRYPQFLEQCGLYMEHPSATKGWCHVQTCPPHSGNRIFYP